jgi:hypothetical protein
MTEAELLAAIQKHVAQISANSSSIRNQGATGMIPVAQKFLRELNLSDFVSSGERAFLARLDTTTDSLAAAFPRGGQHWGIARKILNIFLRDSRYNCYLSDRHELATIETWLEVPLDSHVASNLRAHADRLGVSIPRWTTIKALRPTASEEYQRLASKVASELGIYRAHLDLLWWRNPQ